GDQSQVIFHLFHRRHENMQGSQACLHTHRGAHERLRRGGQSGGRRKLSCQGGTSFSVLSEFIEAAGPPNARELMKIFALRNCSTAAPMGRWIGMSRIAVRGKSRQRATLAKRILFVN